jgi:hypothetical protein
VVGAVTVAFCATLWPAVRLAVDTVAKSLPAAELLDEVMRTTLQEAFAEAIPWFFIVQLTAAPPPAAMLVGLKP